MSLDRYLQRVKRDIGFSHNFLTVVAMISMFLDHAALTLIKNGKLYGFDIDLYNNAVMLDDAKFWIVLYNVMRIIGRLSFPIFAFLIVEGFRKTSNLFKYFLRLLLLAFISEIPYDLMVFNEFLTVRCFAIQNVVFTYTIGLLMLTCMRLMSGFPSFLTVFVAALAAFLTKMLRTDYAIEGIILIYIFYIFRFDLNIKCIFALIVTFLMSIEHYYGTAIFSVFFIYFYDGKKGYVDIGRIAYIFYPLHMLLLYGVLFFTYWK